MRRAQQARVYVIERRAFYATLSCTLVLVAGYIYFVSASITHVVMRKELAQDIRQTELRISELESRYIEIKNGIDESAAVAQGFTPNEERVFVTKKPSNLVLADSEQR